jgi:hypothetical protein
VVFYIQASSSVRVPSIYEMQSNGDRNEDLNESPLGLYAERFELLSTMEMVGLAKGRLYINKAKIQRSEQNVTEIQNADLWPGFGSWGKG